jgi:hypothetical protein
VPTQGYALGFADQSLRPEGAQESYALLRAGNLPRISSRALPWAGFLRALGALNRRGFVARLFGGKDRRI